MLQRKMGFFIAWGLQIPVIKTCLGTMGTNLCTFDLAGNGGGAGRIKPEDQDFLVGKL